jgi:hypothetical protein
MVGELRSLTWDCLTLPSDNKSMAFLEVRQSIWRNPVGEPKTVRSNSMPVLPHPARIWRRIDALAKSYSVRSS